MGIGTTAPGTELEILQAGGGSYTGTGFNYGLTLRTKYTNAGIAYNKAINMQTGFVTGNLFIYSTQAAYPTEAIAQLSASSGLWSALSDGRLKKDFTPLQGTLEKVMQLNPLSYHFKSQTDSKMHLGFIAQDVEPLFPELVSSPKDNPDGEGEGYYQMDYSGFGVLAIKAIQEQQEMIKAQQEQINNLRQEIESLKALLKNK